MSNEQFIQLTPDIKIDSYKSWCEQSELHKKVQAAGIKTHFAFKWESERSGKLFVIFEVPGTEFNDWTAESIRFDSDKEFPYEIEPGFTSYFAKWFNFTEVRRMAQKFGCKVYEW